MDIQRFGDNDTVKTSEELTLQWRYKADPTKKFKIKMPNPKTDLTAASITSAMDYATGAVIFKDDEQVITIHTLQTDTAYTKTTVTRVLDLS